MPWQANAPIFGIDADGLVNEWNRKAAEITGFAKEEVRNRKFCGFTTLQSHIYCPDLFVTGDGRRVGREIDHRRVSRRGQSPTRDKSPTFLAVAFFQIHTTSISQSIC